MVEITDIFGVTSTISYEFIEDEPYDCVLRAVTSSGGGVQAGKDGIPEVLSAIDSLNEIEGVSALFGYTIEESVNQSVELTELFATIDTAESTEATESISTTEEATIYGDLNGDSSTTIGDAVLLNKYLVGNADLSEDYKTAADVNLDGTIDATDATLILGYNVSKITSLPYTE